MESMEGYVKISTYAKKMGKSVTWIYKLAKEGNGITLKIIDGVKFVKEKE